MSRHAGSARHQQQTDSRSGQRRGMDGAGRTRRRVSPARSLRRQRSDLQPFRAAGAGRTGPHADQAHGLDVFRGDGVVAAEGRFRRKRPDRYRCQNDQGRRADHPCRAVEAPPGPECDIAYAYRGRNGRRGAQIRPLADQPACDPVLRRNQISRIRGVRVRPRHDAETGARPRRRVVHDPAQSRRAGLRRQRRRMRRQSSLSRNGLQGPDRGARGGRRAITRSRAGRPANTPTASLSGKAIS